MGKDKKKKKRGTHIPAPSDSKIWGEIKHTHMKTLKNNKNKNTLSTQCTLIYHKVFNCYGEEDVIC